MMCEQGNLIHQPLTLASSSSLTRNNPYGHNFKLHPLEGVTCSPSEQAKVKKIQDRDAYFQTVL